MYLIYDNAGIAQFNPLLEEDDARSCDLLHLVKRSHNTIIKVSIPSVIDNSHVVSMIDRKMCPSSDRKTWPRGLEKDGKLATFN